MIVWPLLAVLALALATGAGQQPLAPTLPAVSAAHDWQLLAPGASGLWRQWATPAQVFPRLPTASTPAAGSPLERTQFGVPANSTPCVRDQKDETRLSAALTSALHDALAHGLHANLNLGSGLAVPVAVKLAWCAAAELKVAGLDPNRSHYLMTSIGGRAFALVGISLSAKDLGHPPFWRFVTFRHQNLSHDPEDSFQQTRAWAALFPRNSALWRFYRLDGEQTGYEQPRILGNPVLDGDVTQPSCLSCHFHAAARADGAVYLPPKEVPLVGIPGRLPLPSGFYRTDFLWSVTCMATDQHDISPCVGPESTKGAAKRRVPEGGWPGAGRAAQERPKRAAKAPLLTKAETPRKK